MAQPDDVKLVVAGLLFTWDAEKADENKAKHGVTFREAATVFLDPLALFLEPETLGGEIRDTIVGWSFEWRTLCVVHTSRGTLTRIISARAPTPDERRRYEGESEQIRR